MKLKCLVIKPFINLPIKKNNLTQKERNYPVDFEFIKDKQFNASISIPNNYKAKEFPENYQLNNDLVDINLNYSKVQNNIVVSGNYKFKKAVYVADECTSIKSYLNTIVNKFNQYVVLEKMDEVASK